jgi:hypothetical protein
VPLPEFWREEPGDERRIFWKQAVRWSLLFLVLCGGVFFAFWWSGSAIHFGASRMNETTAPTYKVSGRALDARTGAPIAWVSVRDDANGGPPFFETLGNVKGEFALNTIAEPHNVVFTALGYQPRRVRVGKSWYLWMPRGEELLEVRLTPERKRE